MSESFLYFDEFQYLSVISPNTHYQKFLVEVYRVKNMLNLAWLTIQEAMMILFCYSPNQMTRYCGDAAIISPFEKLGGGDTANPIVLIKN